MANDLKPETYGAVGDGVTNDTAAVQQCIDAIAQNGQGRIVLSGQYKLTAEVTVNARSILFDGIAYQPSTRATGFLMSEAGKLRLLNAEGTRFERVLFKAHTDKLTDTYLVELDSSSSIVFEGVGFDGASRCRHIKVANGSNRIRFFDIVASGAKGGHAWYFTNSNIFDFEAFSLGADTDTDLMLFEGFTGSARFTNFAMNFGKNAIVLQRAGTAAPGFFYFTAGGWENGSASVFRLLSGKNIQIVGCYIGADSSANPGADGIFIDREVSDVRIVGNVIRAHGRHGVNVRGMNVVIVGNNITRNSTETPNTAHGVNVESLSKGTMISGNNINAQYIWNEETNTQVIQNALQRYGIYVGASSSEVVIQGNNLKGNETGAIGGNSSGGGIGVNLVA